MCRPRVDNDIRTIITGPENYDFIHFLYLFALKLKISIHAKSSIFW